ncbi:MAG: 4Fe-4S dicluster domain-containing protein [Lacunisphaera sp.]
MAIFPADSCSWRSGFARVSRNYNQGERTGSYLGKGQSFGLPELVTSWRTGQQVALRHNLRALGYTDLLYIPATVLEQHVLPKFPAAELDALVAAAVRGTGTTSEIQVRPDEQNLIEFVVAGKFINGRAAMLIDLDRCTQCDDCVRACAATHDNNPRFIRHGPESTGVMVASACMHCVDPVCMIGCPTGAIQRGVSAGGEIIINPDTCIGCGICAQSCPYGTIPDGAAARRGGPAGADGGDRRADPPRDEVRPVRRPAGRTGLRERLSPRRAGAGGHARDRNPRRLAAPMNRSAPAAGPISS